MDESVAEQHDLRATVSAKLRKLEAVVVILAEAKRPDLAERVIADIHQLRGAIEQHAK